MTFVCVVCSLFVRLFVVFVLVVCLFVCVLFFCLLFACLFVLFVVCLLFVVCKHRLRLNLLKQTNAQRHQ